MKHIILSFLVLLTCTNLYSQQYSSINNENFALGFGLVIPANIDDYGIYNKVGIESSFILNKLLFNITATLGWEVGENKYGSGGLSDKHTLLGATIGYLTPYKKIYVTPLFGFCLDNTLYNDAYYDKTVGDSKTYFDFGGVIMYQHKNLLFSLKTTRCFPVGLSVFYVFI